MKLDHIGFITYDLNRFESFWCKGMGFEKIGDSLMLPEKAWILFGEMYDEVRILKYKKDDVVIEVHLFGREPSSDGPHNDFNDYGINHLCLHVGNREELLKDLVVKIEYIEIRKFYDPSGWWNVFIRDWDGNWIELRQTL